MYRCCRLAVVCILSFASVLAHAADDPLRLPAFISDNMVLQRDIQVPLWGWADPGDSVAVSLMGQKVAATADIHGRWKVVLGPFKAGGPFELTVEGKKAVVVKNLLMGDVWFCSGQSNMQMPVSDAEKAADAIKNAQFPKIRLFTVRSCVSATPRDDLEGKWLECHPDTVGKFSAAGYFFGRKIHQEMGIPVGLICSAVGDSSIRTWMNPEALAAEPSLKHHVDIMQKLRKEQAAFLANPVPGKVPGPLRSGGGFLYNAMVAPLVGYGIKGMIWYQGEKDGGLYREYPVTFKVALADWRRSWGQGDFPFLFVQLSTFKGWGDVQASPDPQPNEGSWGLIREAQTQCLAEPNTEMAVSLDRGDFNTPHPKNKQAVGERLALAALAKVYGRDLVYSGPMYKAMKVDGGQIRLYFNHVGSGLVLEGEKGKNGFAIAGEDGQYVWADVAVDGDSLRVWSDKVPKPVSVRYAWANFPYFGLSNKEGLPAPTFQAPPAGPLKP